MRVENKHKYSTFVKLSSFRVPLSLQQETLDSNPKPLELGLN
jgi:hypothetical protein